MIQGENQWSDDGERRKGPDHLGIVRPNVIPSMRQVRFEGKAVAPVKDVRLPGDDDLDRSLEHINQFITRMVHVLDATGAALFHRTEERHELGVP